MKKWDAIIVGAGIAGLGIGAILAKEKGLEVLVLDRHARPGGRLMSFPDYPEKGWTVDVGLHLIELGDQGEAHRLNQRVGKEPKWGPMSETVQLFHDGEWVSVADLIQISPEDQAVFRDLTKKIVGLSDHEIASWDGRSFQEWMEKHSPPGPLRELLATFAMIMTTIPLPIDMAAGEVLYISRENLSRKRQLLSAGYPVSGMRGLTAGLEEVIKEFGGQVRTASRVQEVILEKDRAAGVMVGHGDSPYPHEFRLLDSEELSARTVVCALPIYQLPDILDFSALPSWWGTRIRQIQHEVTGLVGYMIGLNEPLTDKLCFYSLLETPHAQLPFQAFPASNFDPDVAPPGKQIFHTDLVCEYDEANDPIKRRRLLENLQVDLRLLFPGMEERIAWRLPYYVAGCDGLARKPGLVGRFKPELTAPGFRNLYFAGDTYQGRGLAANSAAKSAMDCADLIMEELD